MAKASEFWRRCVESELLSADKADQARHAAAASLGEKADDPQQVARWLVAKGGLSPYQAKLLLAARSGPFFIGEYKIIEPIETGRLARSTRVRHASTRHRALLVHMPAGRLDAAALDRLRNDTASAHAVTVGSDYLLNVFHVVEAESTTAILVDDLQGNSLAEQLATSGRLDAQTAARNAQAVALALAELHAAGMVHGDVRPSNIWITKTGAVRLLGYPLARDPLGPAHFTGLAGVANAEEIDYLAPELANGKRLPDVRSDLYALGCTLYEMLAGHVPFDGGDAASKLGRHVADEPPPLADLDPPVPQAAIKLVAYLMNKDAELRYQRAVSVAQALAPLTGRSAKAGIEEPRSTTGAYLAYLRAHGLPSRPAPAHASPRAIEPLSSATPNPRPDDTHEPPAFARETPAKNELAAIGLSDVPNLQLSSDTTSVAARSRRKVQNAQRRLLAAVSLAAVISGIVAACYALGLFATTRQSDIGQAPAAHSASKQLKETSAASAANENPSHEANDAARTPRGVQAAGGPASPRGGDVEANLTGLDAPLWQAPIRGQPLDLAYLAPGAQAIVAIRPADILAHPESGKLLDERVLSGVARLVSHELPALAGTSLENIEQAIIGLSTSVRGSHEASFVLRLRSPANVEELLDAWNHPAREDVEGDLIYVAGDRAYFVDDARERIVVAPRDTMHDILSAGGAAPPLRLEMEALVAKADASWHATAVFVPYFLTHGGKRWFEPPGDRLLAAWEWFVRGAEITPASMAGTAPTTLDAMSLTWPKAAMLSAHLGETLFVEMRIYDGSDARPALDVAKLLSRRLDETPKTVDRLVRGLEISPYSYDVLYEFPAMVRGCREYVRAGVDGRQTVLRAVWPAHAAHNLALAAHLCLLERPREGSRLGSSVTADNQPPSAQTVAERLEKTTSLRFPRNTLEQALELLAADIGVEIVILGSDLQLEGITKNQSFALDLVDQPASTILDRIVALADPAGRLVWLIKRDESDRDTIYVTTRAAATSRGDPLRDEPPPIR